MAENVNLVSVKVLVNGKEQTIQMEKGVSFENKGGIYNVDENGALKKFDKSKNLWANASDIKMTNYQWKAFNNVANNDGNAKTYTKADIEKAKEYYSQGKFRADMAQDLPEGYKIEKASKPEENTLAVRVSNGKDSQSATLKFSFKPDIESNTDNQVIEQAQVQPTPNVETKEVSPKAPEALVGADPVLVKKYNEEFKMKGTEEIANQLLKQIKGLSNNTETLSMFDAITDDKLIDVIKKYNNLKGEYKYAWDYDPAVTAAGQLSHAYAKTERNLIDALNNELGITIEDLYPRIQRLTDLLKEAYPDNKNEIDKINKLAKPIFGTVDSVSYPTATINNIEYNLQSILKTSVNDDDDLFLESEYDTNWYGIGYHRHNEHHSNGYPIIKDGYSRSMLNLLVSHTPFGWFK